MHISIDIDDQGQATVTVDQGQPHQCGSVDDCIEYLSDMLKGEQPDESNQAQEAAEPSPQDMWNQEAASRPTHGLMA